MKCLIGMDVKSMRYGIPASLGPNSASLRHLFPPAVLHDAHRILELPTVPPVDDLVKAGLSMLQAGAIYAPGPRPPSAEGASSEGVPFCETTQVKGTCGDEGSSAHDAAYARGNGCAHTRCVACNAQHVSAGYARHLESMIKPIVTVLERETVHGPEDESRAEVGDNAELGQRGSDERPGASNARTCEYDKAQRVKVASCLSAMTKIREEQLFFSEAVEQPHLQVRPIYVAMNFVITYYVN